MVRPLPACTANSPPGCLERGAERVLDGGAVGAAAVGDTDHAAVVVVRDQHVYRRHPDAEVLHGDESVRERLGGVPDAVSSSHRASLLGSSRVRQ
ncbi:hypothetical protein SCATT_21970 [Streptantibioticus cattleyicolor NRRL 8057 = DSM 46488]|uniref:Uncharacterized protein n=1 Tax=Streptantibioticus cattleyicolor (strain ATCC 35852 / DSM 46488 / JCM 4925 / NBRC 14057 / NRRL 8057) TaxID=1003195 RepID=G8X2D3_STREN|nr:hypothetical protein SCATT_21970 [Streptantibioticus cattleyicolor NRRL 8057 = DSM 46488]